MWGTVIKIGVQVLSSKEGRKALMIIGGIGIGILLLPVILLSAINPFSAHGDTDPYMTAINAVIREKKISEVSISPTTLKSIDLVIYGEVENRQAQDIKKDIYDYYLDERQKEVEICRQEEVPDNPNDPSNPEGTENEVCTIEQIKEYVFKDTEAMFKKLQEDKQLTNEQITDIKNLIELAIEAGQFDSIKSGGTPVGTTGGYILPTAHGMVTCGYGCYTGHIGTDVGSSSGTPIYAIQSGTVIEIENGCTEGKTSCGGSFGNKVFVSHLIDNKKVLTIYAHMLEGSVVVNVGDQVTAGTQLGAMGNTGKSEGTHLHLEILEGIDYFPSTKAERIKYSVDTEKIIEYPVNW